MVRKVREGLAAIFGGAAVGISAFSMGLTLIVTIPLVVMASALMPSRWSLRKRVVFYVTDWVRSFRLP